MAKIDRRLFCGDYHTALSLGLIDDPPKSVFLSKEDADAIVKGVEEQIRRRNEIRKTIKEMLSVLSGIEEAPNDRQDR
jgi:hypothetical protein